MYYMCLRVLHPYKRRLGQVKEKFNPVTESDSDRLTWRRREEYTCGRGRRVKCSIEAWIRSTTPEMVDTRRWLRRCGSRALGGPFYTTPFRFQVGPFCSQLSPRPPLCSPVELFLCPLSAVVKEMITSHQIVQETFRERSVPDALLICR